MPDDVATRLMGEELPLIRDHFDNQLSVIRSLVEAAVAKQEVNHLAIASDIARVGRDIAEVKSDVKTQNGRVGRLETDVAYMKGQQSGGSVVFNSLLAAFGALLGAVGTALALTQLGG